MRNFVLFLIMLLAICSSSHAFARGGQGADDCPPGSTDPDCAGKTPGK